MLSLSKHLFRAVWISTPSVTSEMLHCVQHDVLFYFLYYALQLEAQRSRVGTRRDGVNAVVVVHVVAQLVEDIG
jgi:hypothetical protein